MISGNQNTESDQKVGGRNEVEPVKKEQELNEDP